MNQLKAAIKNEELTPEEAVEKAFNPFTHIKDVSIERLAAEPLETGFKSFDDNLVLKKGRSELIVVGAGTSHGKSALMLQIAANVAKEGHVFVYSLEMDERDIKARLLAPRINTPLNRIMTGKVPNERLSKAQKEFSELNLHLCTNGRRSVSYIQSTALDMSRRYPPSLVVVDYLQLLSSVSKNTRTQEIADILAELKGLAKDLKCPILIGSQLNRNCERRGKSVEMEKGVGDYRPIKSDLMDSGSIEHDADVIVMLSRQYVYDRTRPNEADVEIVKNRAGRLISTVFEFSGELCSFYDTRPLEEDIF